MPRTILHCDCDAFYASVECFYNPSLRNKPVAVCGDPERRHGIILTRNYIAKKYGVKTGEALWQAKQKCPDIVFVPAHFDKYLTYSELAQDIYKDYSDLTEPFGLDESWLDVTGSVGLLGSGEKIAKEIQNRILFELGITASIGVSYNKVFAKLGSDLNKPAGMAVITPENYREVVWPLPVGDLLYVGSATRSKLRKYGIHTIGELAETDVHWLERRFGKIGVMLWMFANGREDSPVKTTGVQLPIRSVGNSTTTPRDLVSDTDVRITLYSLSESVSERLREYGFRCTVVQINIRGASLFSYERQMKLASPSYTTIDIYQAAFQLYQKHHGQGQEPIRSVGIRGCGLVRDSCMQLSFYTSATKAQKAEQLDRTVDKIRSRFGYFSVQRGLMLTDQNLSNLDAKGTHVIHPVGFLR